jgi:LysW-gamma-L-lysine carboxypeptidase
MLSAIRANAGTPSFVYKTGTADLNIVAPVWDCPGVVYGPGDSALDHTPNEHIALQEYRQAVSVLTAALKLLTAPKQPA